MQRVSEFLKLDIDYRHVNKATQDLVLALRQLEVIERHHALDRELYRYATR